MQLTSGRALRLIAVVWCVSGLLAAAEPAGLLAGTGACPRAGQPRPEDETSSALSAKEAADLVEFHNKVREEVGIEPVKWSPELARFAQEWADEVARTGKLAHRPREGERKQRYGENIAWGSGRGYDVLKAAESWYAEMKVYEPGTPIPQPEDFGEFRAGHYTQMVWKDTTAIGAGKATIQEGERKGWLVVVCNYDPPGNIAGEKPY
jgi:pathogenesis-related protein 1